MSLEVAFSKGLRDVAFELVKVSYDEVRDREEFNLSWDEEEFTKQIYRFMKENLHKVNDYITVNLEDPVTSERTLSSDFPPNKLGRVDISVERVGRRKSNVHFWIECKLVEADNHYLLREYIKSGVNRYVTGKYAEEETDREAMAGYVLQGEPSDVADQIMDKLSFYEERYDDVVNMESNMDIVQRREGILRYHSEHYREESGEFRLEHMFLDFRIDQK